jgi:arsenate reductase-like glutaredoxin family protein
MPITVYGIPNCGSVQKARAWLDGQGLAYEFHDFKKAGLSKDIIVELAKLHAANIIHGDLKQANIIVYKDYAKICDFGLTNHFLYLY